MVFESIISPLKAERKAWEMFFIGIIYSSVAIVLSLIVFREHASLMMVFLTVISTIPLMYGTIRLEEKKDLEISREVLLLKEHWKALSFFIFMFIGFVMSFSMWYIFLPSGLADSAFKVQIDTINEINSPTTGGFILVPLTGNTIDQIGNAIAAEPFEAPSGRVASATFYLGKIFFNNFKVMLFCILFAFIYGIGAIFILCWNASVISAAIGTFVKNGVMGSGFFSSYSFALLRYFTHGIPEILAYFMAGLAAGIISIAVIRHDFGSEKFRRILVDSIDLIIGALVVLLLAALIEVFVTPALF